MAPEIVIRKQIEQERARENRTPHINDLIPINDMVDLILLRLDKAAFAAIADTRGSDQSIYETKLLKNAEVDPKLRAILTAISKTSEVKERFSSNRKDLEALQNVLGEDKPTAMYTSGFSNQKEHREFINNPSARHGTSTLLRAMNPHDSSVNNLKEYLHAHPDILGKTLLSIAQTELKNEYKAETAPGGLDPVIYGLTQNAMLPEEAFAIKLKSEKEAHSNIMSAVRDNVENFAAIPTREKVLEAPTKDLWAQVDGMSLK